jgi:hypothetical protein
MEGVLPYYERVARQKLTTMALFLSAARSGQLQDDCGPAATRRTPRASSRTR